jgi:predicted RNase H-like HicB family nuclease
MSTVKIVVERHSDGYVAYPLGIAGVVIGEGDSYEEALTDVKSALTAYVETFGPSELDATTEVLEAFLVEATVGA